MESSTELKDALRNVKRLNSILIYQTCWTEYIVHNLFVWSQKWAEWPNIYVPFTDIQASAVNFLPIAQITSSMLKKQLPQIHAQL